MVCAGRAGHDGLAHDPLLGWHCVMLRCCHWRCQDIAAHLHICNIQRYTCTQCPRLCLHRCTGEKTASSFSNQCCALHSSLNCSSRTSSCCFHSGERPTTNHNPMRDKIIPLQGATSVSSYSRKLPFWSVGAMWLTYRRKRKQLELLQLPATTTSQQTLACKYYANTVALGEASGQSNLEK